MVPLKIFSSILPRIDFFYKDFTRIPSDFFSQNLPSNFCARNPLEIPSGVLAGITLGIPDGLHHGNLARIPQTILAGNPPG